MVEDRRFELLTEACKATALPITPIPQYGAREGIPPSFTGDPCGGVFTSPTAMSCELTVDPRLRTAAWMFLGIKQIKMCGQ
jgi:hypothetical protein